MAPPRSWFGILALVLVLMGALRVRMVHAQTNPSECKEERRLLVNACRAVIIGGSPSANCCQRVRVTHVECVCPVVTPKLAALIRVQRTIKQIEGCGRTVPRNFKCGSWDMEQGNIRETTLEDYL